MGSLMGVIIFPVNFGIYIRKYSQKKRLSANIHRKKDIALHVSDSPKISGILDMVALFSAG